MPLFEPGASIAASVSTKCIDYIAGSNKMISDSFSFQTRLVDPFPRLLTVFFHCRNGSKRFTHRLQSYVKQLIQMHKRTDFVLRFTHRLQSYIIR